MSFEKKLAKAKTLWKKASDMKPDYDNVITDGTYTGKLVRAELGESQKGRLQVAWRLQVSSGEYKGENINWWSGLETENNIMYFQRDLVRLGKEAPEDPSDLEDVLKEVEKDKLTVRVQVKTSGEFQNVRILKAVDADESEDEVVEEEAEEPEVEAEAEAEESEDEEKESEDSEEEAPEEEEESEAEEEEEPAKEDAEEEDAEPEEEDEESEEAPEVEEGMRVQFSYKGKDIVGTVMKGGIDYKKGTVKIKSDKGLVYKGISPDSLSPAPKVKVKKA